MKNANYLLTGLTLPNGSKSDITISDGVITEIASNIIAAPGFTKVDLAGSIALPGLVDLHTHLREPGKEDAETILSGSMAAAKGGFVAVSAMANTSPVADTAGVVEQVFALGQSAGFADVFPIGAVTEGLKGENLAEIGAMADSRARVRVFSDDGSCVFAHSINCAMAWSGCCPRAKRKFSLIIVFNWNVPKKWPLLLRCQVLHPIGRRSQSCGTLVLR